MVYGILMIQTEKRELKINFTSARVMRSVAPKYYYWFGSPVMTFTAHVGIMIRTGRSSEILGLKIALLLDFVKTRKSRLS